MDIVFKLALLVAGIAVIAVPLRLRNKAAVGTESLSRMIVALLCVAGVLSGLLTLVALAAAAWGMNTTLLWGLGVYMYLIPALTLPSFVLLRFTSVSTLSRVLWFLAVASSFAFYFGDQADRIASGLKPVVDQREIFGGFLNVFTILLVSIAVLVQLASMCRSKERHLAELTDPSNSSGL